MLDLKLIRESRAAVEQALKTRGATVGLSALLELDAQRRARLTELETLRAEKRKASDVVAQTKAKGQPIDAQIAALKTVSQREAGLESQLAGLEGQIKDQLLRIPNIPHASVPVGDAGANREVRMWGTPKIFDFTPKTHLELIESLGLADLPRAGLGHPPPRAGSGRGPLRARLRRHTPGSLPAVPRDRDITD